LRATSFAGWLGFEARLPVKAREWQPTSHFSMVPHEYLRRLARSDLSGWHLRVLVALVPLSWGVGKRFVSLSYRDLADACGMDHGNLWRVVKQLEDRNFLTVTAAGGGNKTTFRILDNPELWKDGASRRPRSPP
jgi:hypothetical protein